MPEPRARLPDRRGALSFALEHGGQLYHCTIGRFPDGRLSEVFIALTKCASDLDDWARDAGILCSIALQGGIPAEVIRTALSRNDQGHPITPLLAALDHALALALEEKP